MFSVALLVGDNIPPAKQLDEIMFPCPPQAYWKVREKNKCQIMCKEKGVSLCQK